MRTGMIGWAITFLVIALVAGMCSFAGIAGAMMGIARICFCVFIVLFAGCLAVGHLVPEA